jgi:curved DNA-binding protein CbpA
MPTHYEILGVDERAPRSVIRSAYLEQMRRVHPDRNWAERSEASVSAADLTVAYTTLKDQFSRASYDFHLARVRYPAVGLKRLEPPRSRFRPPASSLYLLWVIGLALLINYSLAQRSPAPATDARVAHGEPPKASAQQQASLSVTANGP